MIIRLLLTVFLTLLPLLGPPAFAQEAENAARATQLTDRIEALQAQTNTPEILKQLDLLLNAQDELEKTAEFEQLTQHYRQLVETFPARTA